MKNRIAKLLDTFGFTIALIVQLCIMSISMSLLGYQWYMKAGFIAIGWVVVLFAIRAYIKGKNFKNRVLWAMFALVSIFFSWSFALVGTDVQTQATVSVESITMENDQTLATIRGNLLEARQDGEDLSKEYAEAFREDTIDSILKRMEQNADKISNLENKESDRMALIESGSLTERKRSQASAITADSIFSAIPDAIKSGRWLHIIIFGLVFIGLELTLITAVQEDIDKEPEAKQPPKKEKKAEKRPKKRNGAKTIQGIDVLSIKHIILTLTVHGEYPWSLLEPEEAHEKFIKYNQTKGIKIQTLNDIKLVRDWIENGDFKSTDQNGNTIFVDKEIIIQKAMEEFKE